MGQNEIDSDFLERISPTVGGILQRVPPPRLSPEARLQRRLSFRNQIYVHLRPCSWTKRRIFSHYPDTSPFPVIENEVWWGDSWDELEYGRDLDFSRPFFEQFEDLRNCVPHPGRAGINFENSDYCNNGANMKNCYMVFATHNAEDCMYCENVWFARDCIDCTRCPRSELCYDCVECADCYALQSSVLCQECF